MKYKIYIHVHLPPQKLAIRAMMIVATTAAHTDPRKINGLDMRIPLKRTWKVWGLMLRSNELNHK